MESEFSESDRKFRSSARAEGVLMYGNPNREEIEESIREKARAKKGIRFTCAWNWNWCEESVDQKLTGR